MTAAGSSPLARGLPSGRPSGSTTGRDHPRSRGVYESYGWVTSHKEGSSPLARGLRTRSKKSTKWPRIIPARAGFTGRRAVPALAVPDHPRSRGVYASSSSQAASSAGSSPLARGLHEKRSPRHPCPGIIPARAGFTPGQPSSRYGTSGSSPLARGLRRADRVSGRRPGIIPARAGFTFCADSLALSCPDHPRSRGVYPCPSPLCTRIAGSSPLARGLLVVGQYPLQPFRIIPARAGFTLVRTGVPCGSQDHPRSRGVYEGPGHPVGWPGRIIPARAGFTGREVLTRRGRPDHPRSRGVYAEYIVGDVWREGSSPLARGLQ